MARYKIIIAYDGTDFYGWQVQAGQNTVAGTLQNIFYDVFGKEIRLVAASRTDAGVHALGQCAAFDVDFTIDHQQLKQAWQNMLPASLLLRSLTPVGPAWNPRKNVQQKTYYYHFFQERPLPMLARYGWYYRHHVDLKKLEQALQIFVGTHDFRSFCTGNEYENTQRTIDKITIEYLHHFKAHRIVVKGPGFLRYMIRRIVGACIEVASRPNAKLEELHTILEQKNPEQLLFTAPPQGLLLYKIIYANDKGQ